VAGTLINNFPAWIASALIVGIPLGSAALYNTRRARALERQVRALFNYDRRYEQYFDRWVFRQADIPGYWAATYYCERDFTALRPMPEWVLGISRVSERDLPFTVTPPTAKAVQVTRSGAGRCLPQEIDVQAAKVRISIEFEPALRPGESVQVSLVIDIPQFKAGTVDTLRLRDRVTPAPPANTELLIREVQFPTVEYRVELVIPERLGSKRHSVQVFLRGYKFLEEETLIERAGAFTVTRADLDGDTAWVMTLARYAPPLRAHYRFLWEPPHQ
jgi:hypothetical protein